VVVVAATAAEARHPWRRLCQMFRVVVVAATAVEARHLRRHLCQMFQVVVVAATAAEAARRRPNQFLIKRCLKKFESV
jgi:hypothetical protein